MKRFEPHFDRNGYNKILKYEEKTVRRHTICNE